MDEHTTGPSGPGLLHELLDAAVDRAPDRTAVRDPHGAWTWRELAQHSKVLAEWLRGQGLAPHDRLLVRLGNRRETVALLFAASRCGATTVPVNPEMKDYHLRSVLADCTPRLVVAPDGGGAQVAALTTAPVHELADLWWAAVDTQGLDPADGYPESALTVDGWQRPDPATPGVLIYTSGSTSAPKGVICPHAQMTFAADAIQQVLGYRADDVVFCRVPLSFDYGLFQVLLCCLSGAELVLAGGEPDTLLLRRVRESGATVLPLVPSLGGGLIRLASRDPEPTRLRMFTNTGAALEQQVIDGLWAAFPGARVVRMFGTTECKRITVMPPEQDHERPGSSGPALPGTRVAILDEDGRELPAGATGEITVTGPHVMAGYWNLPEVTARTFRTDPATGLPRLHTGDYGRLDEDGYLYFEGRRDDMFKRKGHRVSTIEIEAAAMDVPGVRAAAALPPTADRDLVLFVAADALAPQAVLRELARRLEPAKVPAECRVLAEFPLTDNGKNAKQPLVRLLADERAAADRAAEQAAADRAAEQTTVEQTTAAERTATADDRTATDRTAAPTRELVSR